MSKKGARIARAWCHELDAEVSITEARIAYLSLENPPKRFTFYCHDPACRILPKRVKVTGVNYRALAENSEKYVSEYFRSKTVDQHHPDCAWLREDELSSNESNNHDNALGRSSKRKLTDLVTIFDPKINSKDTHELNISKLKSIAADAPTYANKGNRQSSHDIEENQGDIKTNSFERLVNSYQEAKENLDKDDFKKLSLHVIGRGDVSYSDYFQWVGSSDGSGVIYGGGYVDAIYDAGIRLRFFDKNSGKNVNLFISESSLQKFKHRRFIDVAVKEVFSNRNKYLKIFCMGDVLLNEKFDCWEIKLHKNSHLSLSIISKTVPDESFL